MEFSSFQQAQSLLSFADLSDKDVEISVASDMARKFAGDELIVNSELSSVFACASSLHTWWFSV